MRIVLLTIIIFIISIYRYSDEEELNLLVDDNQSTTQELEIKSNKEESKEHTLERPAEGVSTFIGNQVEYLIESFGFPSRKDPSPYNFEWWIYNDSYDTYMQVGVKNNKVVTVYAAGDQLNVQPFHIGQSVEEIYQTAILEPEFVLESKLGTYRFELSEEDLNVRPLIRLDDIYVQLVIDKYTELVSSVRMYDKDTLLIQRPYELFYRGDLQQSIGDEAELWDEIAIGSAKQIFDLTNVIRNRFELESVEWNEEIAEVAYNHSVDMQENEFFSHESKSSGDLSERLKTANISYEIAGENIAADYVDGPAAVDGWLNSEGHRATLLNPDFEELGVGVYKKYYTQNFFTKANE